MTAFHTDSETWHEIRTTLKTIFEAFPEVFTQHKLHDITASRNAKNNQNIRNL